MSVKNFYQTLYQTDQLFRLAGESWTVSAEQPAEPSGEPSRVTDANMPDLLSELEALSVGLETKPVETMLVDTPVTIPMAVPAEPQPVVVTAMPEPLPQPAPRPTTPSILPPLQQQPRMPQLNHKVLLLADEELDPSNLLFLEKILKAVNLNVNGVDLLNLHGAKDMDFAELLKGKYINHFITFGVPFERINLDIMMDRYSPVRFEGITFLMADSLPTIEADQNLKKRLWAALQRVFLQR
ncbi:hypothetical protein HNV11_09675 [Spirosoma taeanense]|uniref:Uncharacterized protein n=1 Tax=Spirosoma taeanense TaxID=2735870 RepID=A0A6M5Y9Y3_9BACT|nr:hypothetical protein [Spirosoma taeanense]QJW89632.1 hypothetical protein HNV11_09675 [Spirosoma taeanense]